MNTKMKVLSLALIALGGFAGSAMAACPAGPTTAQGGAWSSSFVTTGASFAIAPGGLDGSACKALSTINNSTTAAAAVVNTIGSTEPSYRFQFLVDTGALSAFGATDAVTVFRGNAAASSHGSNNLVTVALLSGATSGTYRVRFIAACNTAPVYKCAQSSPVDLPAGVHRIEAQLLVGATSSGQLNYWVDAAAGTTAPTPTGTISNLDNAAWTGVNSAILGLIAPTSSLGPTIAGKAVGFDAFDSRRQTYIGH